MMETNEVTAPFDAEGMVWDYRFAHSQGDKVRVKQLNKEWADWQGEDSLHEMAFGELVPDEAYRERLVRNARELRRTAKRQEALQAEQPWIKREMPSDD
jgi:hypothetical protein